MSEKHRHNGNIINKTKATGAALVVAATLLAGCSSDGKGSEKASVPATSTVEPARDRMPSSTELFIADTNATTEAKLNAKPPKNVDAWAGVLKIDKQGQEPVYVINPLIADRMNSQGKQEVLMGILTGVDSYEGTRYKAFFFPFDYENGATDSDGKHLSFSWVDGYNPDIGNQDHSTILTVSMSGRNSTGAGVTAASDLKGGGTDAGDYNEFEGAAFAFKDGAPLLVYGGQVIPIGLKVTQTDMDNGLLADTVYAGIR